MLTALIVAGIAIAIIVLLVTIKRRLRPTVRPIPATIAGTGTPPIAPVTTPVATTVTTATTTVTPAKKEEGQGLSFGGALGLIIILLILWGIGAMVIEAFKPSNPKSQTSVVKTQDESAEATEATRRKPVPVQPVVSPTEKTTLFTVYRKETQIPRAENNSTIRPKNLADIFVVRGERNGRSIGEWQFQSKMDKTTHFPDADVYYIRCVNRDISYIEFVPDPSIGK